MERICKGCKKLRWLNNERTEFCVDCVDERRAEAQARYRAERKAGTRPDNKKKEKVESRYVKSAKGSAFF